jgi:hypothetical protein
MEADKSDTTAKHYFVDEAGDPNLFGSRGKVLVGQGGARVSLSWASSTLKMFPRFPKNYSIFGSAFWRIPILRTCLQCNLRSEKTALLLHAKDDLPEVRREVFNLLLNQKIRFSAVVRDKLQVLSYVRKRNETDPDYRYNPNELYDFMVRRLFKERLHQHGVYRICFARRGASDRTQALTAGLERARLRFAAQKGIYSNPKIEVVPASPVREVTLQAVDYFLWALQRTFEKNEDRFLTLLWPKCSLVIDVDDTREKGYGTYYTKQKPLTAAALKAAEGYRSESPK